MQTVQPISIGYWLRIGLCLSLWFLACKQSSPFPFRIGYVLDYVCHCVFLHGNSPAHFHWVLVTYWTMSVTLVLCMETVQPISIWYWSRIGLCLLLWYFAWKQSSPFPFGIGYVLDNVCYCGILHGNSPAHFHWVLVTYWTMSVTVVLCMETVQPISIRYWLHIGQCLSLWYFAWKQSSPFPFGIGYILDNVCHCGILHGNSPAHFHSVLVTYWTMSVTVVLCMETVQPISIGYWLHIGQCLSLWFFAWKQSSPFPFRIGYILDNVYHCGILHGNSPAHFHSVLVTYWTMSVTVVLCMETVQPISIRYWLRTYGCQTWSLNEQMTNKLRTAQRATERKIDLKL